MKTILRCLGGFCFGWSIVDILSGSITTGHSAFTCLLLLICSISMAVAGLRD